MWLHAEIRTRCAVERNGPDAEYLRYVHIKSIVGFVEGCS